MVIVDSDVWSEAFRRPGERESWQVERLRRLIETGEVQLIGPIRQEVLSGIRHPGRFRRVRDALRPFPDGPLRTGLYELAASYFNTCRQGGVQGSHTDFLICACAVAWGMRILSKDHDYDHYARFIPVETEST